MEAKDYITAGALIVRLVSAVIITLFYQKIAEKEQPRSGFL